MSDNQHNHGNSKDVELPLTEEEHEQADAETQIQNLVELGIWNEVRERDDTEKVFELRAGKPPERTEVDTRRFIQLYDTPAGWFYVVDGPALTDYKLSDEKPPVSAISDDAFGFIEHATKDHGLTFKESYEIVNNGVDEVFIQGLLSDLKHSF